MDQALAGATAAYATLEVMNPGLSIALRRATEADIPWLERWDSDPDVIRATSDVPQDRAFGGLDWQAELLGTSDVSFYLIGELVGEPGNPSGSEQGNEPGRRPIAALQIVDPHVEPTHYWGEVEPNLRAIDIWIGDPQDRGRGYGTELMRQAHAQCFSDPAVRGILIDPLASNVRAIAFYRRLGYRSLGRRMLDDDDTEVMWLDRATYEERSGSDGRGR